MLFKKKIIHIFLILILLIAIYQLSYLIQTKENNYFEIKIDLVSMPMTFTSKCWCKLEKIQIVKNLTQNNYIISIDEIDNSGIRSYEIDKNEFETSKLSCDLYSSLRRGKSVNVIGYSVFGRNNFYTKYLKLISKTAKLYYPNWIIRIYHDDSLKKPSICEIECQTDKNNNYLGNVDFCDISKLPYKTELDFNYLIPTFWRWLPVGDTFVDRFLSRDTDFCIVEREQAAVLEWISRNTTFHIMRDHPLHDLYMLAGLWGMNTSKDRLLSNRIFNLITDKNKQLWHQMNSKNKQADQDFLRDYLWDIVSRDVTIHDSFHCKNLGGIPFPTQRPQNYYCHVGGYGCCGYEYLNSSFPYECPYECRPNNHKEWVFC